MHFKSNKLISSIGWTLVFIGMGMGLMTALWLWSDLNQWQEAVFPWAISLLLQLIGGFLIGGNILQKKSILRTIQKREIIIFCFIFLLAIAVRIYKLDTIPSAIFIDETNASLEAINILEGNPASPFTTGWYETPNGYIYYMAFLYKLFGAGFLTLKAVSIIPAVLTVPAVYLLGRYLFGPFIGLFAMFFMAISRWHITMSRWGWNEVVPPLFQTLGLYLLMRGLREQRAVFYTISGIVHGLVLYSYLSSRLIIAATFLFIMIVVVGSIFNRRKYWKETLMGIVLFLLAWFITVLPLSLTYIKDPFTFVNRSSQVSIFREIKETNSIKPLISNTFDHLRFFYWKGDNNARHNLPGAAMLDPATGILFGIGLCYSALMYKRRRYLLLLLWIPFGLAGGILSTQGESPQAYRTLNTVPAIAILAAVGLSILLKSQKSKTIVIAGSFVIGIASAGYELNTYFFRQANDSSVKASYSILETNVAYDVLQAVEEGTDVYVSPRFSTFSPLRFLMYQKYGKDKGIKWMDQLPYKQILLERDLPLSDLSKDVLFLLDYQYLSLMPYINSYYSDAQFETVTGSEKQSIYLKIQIDQNAIVQSSKAGKNFKNGLKAIYYPNTNWKGSPTKEEIIPFLLTTWNKEYFSAAFSGRLVVGKTGFYDFYLTGDDGVRLMIDNNLIGESLLPDRPNEVREKRKLTAGHHDIQIDYFQNGGGSNLEFYWQQPQTQMQPVAPEFLLPTLN